ncbi:MAG: putative sulfate/molybdate transporter [Syntrophomonadaceae bacterium]|nr:putative sulfate/molybdate transporter [Syntrophomonadaceae bacterium]MDD3023729.1 putative sulfate/molybdate transporter [Syntrophomonadaceae bacterium]
MMYKDWDYLSGEISGSLGDLGTFLPYIIAAIVIGGLDATGVLFCFGLMYIFTAWYYKMPMPVQPMKIIAAAVILHNLSKGEIAAAGFMTALTLLILALTGWAGKLSRFIPAAITFGIQAGLGFSLAILGIKLIRTDLPLGLTILLIILLLFNNRKLPSSLIAVVGGTILAFMLHPALSFPNITLGFYLPQLSMPQWADFQQGFTLAYLPQLPLTLTNSVLVTAVLAKNLYPDRSERVNENSLCLTLGIGNLIAIPLGGFPMCHGSGGLAAHYRFGGRTGLTLVIIGFILLLTAVLLGPNGVALLKVIPEPVLGGLLFYSGVDLIRGVKNIESSDSRFAFVIVVIATLAVNPAVAFLTGVLLTFLLKKEWVKI